jgi:ABC-2 type transport system permease protein
LRRCSASSARLKTFVSTPQSQAASTAQSQWQPLKIVPKDVRRERRGPDNAFEITFPQGVIWGLIGCMMTFGISLVTERTHGTFVRLRMAPLTRAQILRRQGAGLFPVDPPRRADAVRDCLELRRASTSMAMLALAGVSAAICFVGFMMLVAGLGKSEETAAGAAWAFLMPLAMIGGAMVPTFVMPAWIAIARRGQPDPLGDAGDRGRVWRNFSIGEMVLPCTILISVGIACFAIGTRGLKEA